MTDDELDALRAADPLDPASVPSPDDPRAQALFERIMMSDATTRPANAQPTTPRPRRAGLLAAAAVALVALVGGTIALTGDDTDSTPTPDDVATGSITPGGPASASCVELYDLDTLGNREIAFDGTVTAVDGDTITFTVNRWYRGGDADEVTLAGAAGLSGLTSAGSATSVEPGTRLLVAGDGGFAWACGFTQPYDPAVAEDWNDVFAG